MISQSGGANLLFGQNFPEKCMKMKEFGPGGWGGGARVPGTPRLDPSMFRRIPDNWHNVVCNKSHYFQNDYFHNLCRKVNSIKLLMLGQKMESCFQLHCTVPDMNSES